MKNEWRAEGQDILEDSGEGPCWKGKGWNWFQVCRSMENGSVICFSIEAEWVTTRSTSVKDRKILWAVKLYPAMDEWISSIFMGWNPKKYEVCFFQVIKRFQNRVDSNFLGHLGFFFLGNNYLSDVKATINLVPVQHKKLKTGFLKDCEIALYSFLIAWTTFSATIVHFGSLKLYLSIGCKWLWGSKHVHWWELRCQYCIIRYKR